MAQQVVHRGGPLRALEHQRAVALHAHGRVGELGQVLRHRVHQLQPAGLGQHERGERDDGLGHRVDAEHRVLRHGLAARRVEPAQRLEMLHLATGGHQRDRARDAPGVDVLLQHLRQAAERGRVQSGHGQRSSWVDGQRPAQLCRQGIVFLQNFS